MLGNTTLIKVSGVLRKFFDMRRLSGIRMVFFFDNLSKLFCPTSNKNLMNIVA